eukprot:5753821-Amphidinium_carterae.1
MLTGKVLFIDQSQNHMTQIKSKRSTQLIMQYMMVNLGGEALVNKELAQCRNHPPRRQGQIVKLTPDMSTSILRDQFAQRRTNTEYDMAWADKKIRDETSPIFGWPVAQVLQTLANVRHTVGIAKKLYIFYSVPVDAQRYE